ncbi:MAG: hypothetical protein JW395_3550 [Nitrospira sp.]|nr:hypothetical protein [Nitrospira sp.]
MQLGLLLEKLFQFIGACLAHLVADCVVFVQHGHEFFLALFDDFFHRLVRIKLWFLLKQAHAVPLRAGDLTGIVLIDSGDDPEQRTLARSIQAQHTDLRAEVEPEIDLSQHLLLRRIDLSDIDERENYLFIVRSRHVFP